MWTEKNRSRYNRDHLRYPSDVTDEEWEMIAPLIPSAKRGGGKRRVDRPCWRMSSLRNRFTPRLRVRRRSRMRASISTSTLRAAGRSGALLCSMSPAWPSA